MSGAAAEDADRLGWDGLDAVLVTLRACGSLAELVACAADLAVRACEADAAAIGRVSGGHWVPWLRSGGPSVLDSDEIVPAGPVALAGAWPLEERVLDSGCAAVREVPLVVVAPIRVGGVALGLLHVAGRDLRAEVVDSYAQALGSMFGLVGVRARAEEQRYTLARLRHGLADGGERPIELYDDGPGPRGTRLDAVPAGSGSSVLRARLTARQREVLDLMTSGLSNAEMAERLVVTVPTVKSHVRAVLRVSGAVNRSDAVARFARGEGPTGG